MNRPDASAFFTPARELSAGSSYANVCVCVSVKTRTPPSNQSTATLEWGCPAALSPVKDFQTTNELYLLVLHMQLLNSKPALLLYNSHLPYIASGGRHSVMSHHYFPFRATTFDSSGQNYFFKWYNPAASWKNAQLKPFFQFYIRLIYCVLNC